MRKINQDSELQEIVETVLERSDFEIDQSAAEESFTDVRKWILASIEDSTGENLETLTYNDLENLDMMKFKQKLDYFFGITKKYIDLLTPNINTLVGLLIKLEEPHRKSLLQPGLDTGVLGIVKLLLAGPEVLENRQADRCLDILHEINDGTTLTTEKAPGYFRKIAYKLLRVAADLNLGEERGKDKLLELLGRIDSIKQEQSALNDLRSLGSHTIILEILELQRGYEGLLQAYERQAQLVARSAHRRYLAVL